MWAGFGLSTLGLPVNQLTLGFMSLIILLFTWINYRGASETGTIGNVVTMTKVKVIMVKRCSGPLHSLLRQTVLEPCTNTEERG